MNFIFFGGEPLAVPILDKLKSAGLTPSLIVCNPDRPSGRGHKLTPPPTKVWAEAAGIPIYQPASYKDEAVKDFFSTQTSHLFVVVAYNFILPDWLLKIPSHGVLNVHPSLLPKLRGASPIRTAILENQREDIGVSIILLDTEMDHGPILEQEQLILDDAEWPLSGIELDKRLADLGGELLAEAIPAWLAGELLPQEQDHESATYCGRLHKAQSEIRINPLALPTGRDAKKIWHTINAFAGIGDTFFMHNGLRIKLTQAKLDETGTLQPLRVIPEGKKEVAFADYLKTVQ